MMIVNGLINLVTQGTCKTIGWFLSYLTNREPIIATISNIEQNLLQVVYVRDRSRMGRLPVQEDIK